MSRAAPPRHQLNTLLQLSVWFWPLSIGLFCGGMLWAIPPRLGGGGDMREIGARLFVLGLCSGPVWFVLSKVVKSPRRVLWHATLCSALAVPPIVATFGLMTAGYFALFSQTSLVRALQYLAIAFAAAVWISIDLQGLRKRVVAKRYMEREFIEFDDHVELRWERKTDIEAPPISNASLLGRLWNQHGWKIAVLIAPLSGAGYAMSRLLERAGGDEANFGARKR